MSGVVEQLPVVGSLYSTAGRFQEGDWAGGVVSMAGVITSGASWIEDPIKAGLSWALGMVIDRLQPLQDALDELVGDPGVTEAKAAELMSASSTFDAEAEALEAELERTRREWEGAGAMEFSENAWQLLEGLRGLSFTYLAMGAGFQLASGIVAAVRQFVVDLIKDLLARLIKYLAEALAFPGLSWPKIAFEVTRAVRDTLVHVTSFTSALDDAMDKGADNIDQILALLRDFNRVMKPIVAAYDRWRQPPSAE